MPGFSAVIGFSVGEIAEKISFVKVFSRTIFSNDSKVC